MLARYQEGTAKGFTTNPTLMKKAGISNYAEFAQSVLAKIKDLPISFEVFSDDFSEMKEQARKINSWAENVFVKIPVSNTKGELSVPLIRELLDEGIKINCTAILSEDQIRGLREILNKNDEIIVSIFAGRIADTGRDPISVMKWAVDIYKDIPKAKILWASPREALNIYQAEACGCHIITMTDELFSKLKLKNKDLTEFSLETVKMFYDDAKAAGFTL